MYRTKSCLLYIRRVICSEGCPQRPIQNKPRGQSWGRLKCILRGALDVLNNFSLSKKIQSKGKYCNSSSVRHQWNSSFGWLIKTWPVSDHLFRTSSEIFVRSTYGVTGFVFLRFFVQHFATSFGAFFSKRSSCVEIQGGPYGTSQWR